MNRVRLLIWTLVILYTVGMVLLIAYVVIPASVEIQANLSSSHAECVRECVIQNAISNSTRCVC